MTASMMLATSWLDALDTAGKVILFGMALTVVLLLVIVRLCLKIYRATCKDDDTAPQDVPVAFHAAPVSPAQATDDAATVAAITAAIQAYRDAEGIPQSAGFRVVSFKRK